MKLLALDTSTEVCSVAVSMDGRVLERNEAGNRHAERILAMVDALLAEAGVTLNRLDGIAFGRGPGSFTGLRIGAGVAQGLAFGAGLSVAPVSSLAALAQIVDAPRVLAALDARMNQVYWGAYQRNADGLMEPLGEECVINPSEVPIPAGEGWTGVGPGWAAYETALKNRCGSSIRQLVPDVLPSARGIVQLGEAVIRAGKGVRPEQAIPVYLRDNVAVKAAKV